jgi:uncharacterized membrane protein
VAAVISILLLIAGAQWLTAHLSGRAAYLHVGAMLGTIMAGNVAFTIMPSQRELVAALRAGRAPSQEIADQAKTRSIHNNYLTFPVIALMLSAHFPSLYAHRGNLALLTLLAGGAAARYALNIRFTDRRWGWKLGAVVAASILLLAIELDLGSGFKQPSNFVSGRSGGAAMPIAILSGDVSFADVRRIIDRRCTACHSATPSDVSLGVTPAGVAFDSPEQIRALVPRIRERAIVTQTMPPANKTRITDMERAMLAKWISDGAPIK